jgi:hypothetical protein
MQRGSLALVSRKEGPLCGSFAGPIASSEESRKGHFGSSPTVIKMSYKSRQNPANCEKNAKVERVSKLRPFAATCCFFSVGVGSGKI